MSDHVSVSARGGESRRDVMRRLRDCLSGRAEDPTGAVDALKLRCGLALLSKVLEDFDVKSRGGHGEVGGVWPPLSPVTLALRRVGKGKAVRERLARQMAAYPPEKQAAIRSTARLLMDVFRGATAAGLQQRSAALAILRKKRSAMEPKRYAEMERLLSGRASMAVMAAVSEAAAHHLILVDQGLLRMSLTPNSHSPETINRTGPGFVEVGTNQKTAAYHNSAEPRVQKKDGSGPRLPRRQILPDEGETPQSWKDAVADALAEGLRDAAFWNRFLGR